MARTELPNGVILPAEYSDDWYEDMTSNLTKLDDVIGSDSEKLNSNDVAFLRMSSAALTDGGTGNFSDLNSSNKLKTGDYVLDSGRKLYQVVSVDSTNETFTVGNSLFKITAESDLAPVAESGDYDDLDNKPDLNPYDQHIVNTDIHVTTADKTKWNNGVTQAYVLRYSSTAITDNSTIAYSTLDNTDNIKVSDKIIDTDGKIFSIVSVDSDNSTVTVGSALIDLALDANVVHKSGNETVGGQKTFSDTANFASVNVEDIRWKSLVNQTVDLNYCYVPRAGVISGYYTTDISSGANISNKAVNTAFTMLSLTTRSVSASDYNVRQVFYGLGAKYIRTCSNGTWTAWVNETDKFVTTDTSQTISGTKTFTDNNMIKTSSPKVLLINTSQTGNTAPSSNTASFLRFDGGTVNNFGGVQCEFLTTGENRQTNYVKDITTAKLNSIQQRASSTTAMTVFNADLLAPANDGVTALGSSSKCWSDCQTKLINGITPSSLSLPVAPSSTSYVDISGYITVVDGSSANIYTPPSNGYITFSVTGNLVQILHDYGLQGKWSTQAGNANRGFIPVLGGVGVRIYIIASSIDKFWFIPCQGNV